MFSRQLDHFGIGHEQAEDIGGQSLQQQVANITLIGCGHARLLREGARTHTSSRCDGGNDQLMRQKGSHSHIRKGLCAFLTIPATGTGADLSLGINGYGF